MGYKIDEVVALNVRTLRLERKLTQEALAERAGVSKQTISNIEKGLGATSKTLESIAECLETSPLTFYQIEHLDTDIQFKRVTPKVVRFSKKQYAAELEKAVDTIVTATREHICYTCVLPAIRETFAQNQDEVLACLDVAKDDKSYLILSALMDSVLDASKQAIFNDADGKPEREGIET